MVFFLLTLPGCIERSGLRHHLPDLQIDFPQDDQGSRVRSPFFFFSHAYYFSLGVYTQYRRRGICITNDERLKTNEMGRHDRLTEHATNKHNKTIEECFPTFQQ